MLAEDITEGVVYEKNGVKVTAFDVDHELIKPALGYRIDYGGRSVVISGDTRFSENLIRFATGTDVVVHEVAAAKAELLSKSERVRHVLGFHTMPEEAGTVFARVKPKLAVYTHLGLLGMDSISAPTSEELIALTRKTYAGPLEVGEDLLTIKVGWETRWKCSGLRPRRARPGLKGSSFAEGSQEKSRCRAFAPSA